VAVPALVGEPLPCLFSPIAVFPKVGAKYGLEPLATVAFMQKPHSPHGEDVATPFLTALIPRGSAAYWQQ
jgi:hypothetical protein